MVDLVLHPLDPGIGVNGFSLDAEIAERYFAALIGTITIVLGIFIIRRVPGNLIGPLLIVWGAGYTGYATRIEYGSPMLTSLMHLIFGLYTGILAFPALIVLVMIFPTGKIYPRWAVRWVALYVVLYVITGLLQAMTQSPSVSVSELGAVSLPVNPLFVPALAPYYALINGPISTLVALLGLVAAFVSLVLRYREAHMRERQQIKWFIWVTCMVLVLLIPDLLGSFLNPNGAPSLSLLEETYLIVFYALLGAFPAIAIGLGILRSQLWEIDIIINRTLVYGILTVMLAFVYFGLIFGLQYVLRGIISQQNDIAIVVSTLAIAALFQPLRQRIQRMIDRRFYRRKYDAAKIVEAFSATLRNEVDLSQLREHLLTVVQDTMQPSHISLWLRETDRKSSHPDRIQS
jgi:hypothetical protein